MSSPRQRKNLRQESMDSSVRVQDCRIWAEINYLDSPTDYREYLLESKTPSERIQGAAFTVLDCRHPLKTDLPRLLLLLLAVASLLISGYLLYRVVDPL